MENVQPYQVLIPILIAVVIGIGFLIFADRPHLSREIRRRLARDMSSPPEVWAYTSTVRYTPDSAGSERTNEPANLDEPALQSRTDEGTGAFVLNPDEQAAVARMIQHKTTAQKPTKASTIWEGFAVKKGDSTKYQRASAIYDALFVVPPSVTVTPIAERATPAKFASDPSR